MDSPLKTYTSSPFLPLARPPPLQWKVTYTTIPFMATWSHDDGLFIPNMIRASIELQFFCGASFHPNHRQSTPQCGHLHADRVTVSS